MLSAELCEQAAVCSHPWLVKLDNEKNQNIQVTYFLLLLLLNKKKKSVSNSPRKGTIASNRNQRCESACDEKTEEEGKEGAEQMNCTCNRALIASPGCGNYKGYYTHSTYRYNWWHLLCVFAAGLETFLIMQAIRTTEGMLHCGPGPAGVSFWQEYSRAICSCRCAWVTVSNGLYLLCAAGWSQDPPKAFCWLQGASEWALRWFWGERDEFFSPDTNEVIFPQGT